MSYDGRRKEKGEGIGQACPVEDVGGSPGLPALDGSNLTGIDAGVTWEEEDGAPSVTPTTIKVTNGTLTDNGDGTVSISG